MNCPPVSWAMRLRWMEAYEEEARRAALARQTEAENSGSRERKGWGCGTDKSRDQALEWHFRGCCGEIALARHLGVPWNWNIGGDRKKPDVAYCDVRFSANPRSPLALRPGEVPTRPHCLIVGPIPDVWFIGWVYGYDGMVRRYWRPDIGRWIIPQVDLLPWPIPAQRFPYPYRKDAA